MSKLEEAKKELKLLEEQEAQEAEEYALGQVKKHLPHMKVKSIQVQKDPYNIMYSRLSVSVEQDFFSIEFEDGTKVHAQMNNTRRDSAQPLLIRHPNENQSQVIEKPLGLQINPKEENFTICWEKTAAFIGVSDEFDFEKNIILLQRWWADLESILVIYITHMNNCIVEYKRPGQMDYFGHLLSKCHDTFH